MLQRHLTIFNIYCLYKIFYKQSLERTKSDLTSHKTSPQLFLIFNGVPTGLLTTADYISIAHRAATSPYAPNTKTEIVSSVCGRAH